MSKVRVYELARECGVETKQLMNRLKEWDIVVSSHQSTLNSDQIVKIKKSLLVEMVEESRAEESLPQLKSSSTTVIRRRKAVEVAQVTVEEKSDEVTFVSSATSKDTVIDPVVFLSDTPVTHILSVDSDAVDGHAPAEHNDLLHGLQDLPVIEEVKNSSNQPIRPSHEKDNHLRLEDSKKDAISHAKTVSFEERIVEPKETLLTQQSQKDRRFDRPQSQTATIVRRATVEEIQARKVVSSPRPGKGRYPLPSKPADNSQDREPSSAGSSSNMNPHHKRQSGFQQNAVTSPSVPFSNSFDSTGTAPIAKEGGRGRNFSERKKSSYDSAESDVISKKTVVKQKREHLNFKNLIDGSNELVPEEELDISVTVQRKRTVYTPSTAFNRKDVKRRKDLKKTQVTVPRAAYRIVKMGDEITVAELGKQLGVKASDIIKKLMMQGMMITMNQVIDFDITSLIATEYGFEVQSNLISEEFMVNRCRDNSICNEIEERSPIVTIMGHVDHGKTSILDAIRHANVAAGEAGGITQHIGAYTAEIDGKKIAFLDTPGHEAFSSMRARGAKVTDIVVLVVAADDGVMPQTVEAITHAREANVPIIIAINKIDKPNINLDRISSELMEHAIQSEEWGGEHQFVKVSALEKKGINELLEAILLQAELLELTASPSMPAIGVVIEANLDKGRGPVATVMVQNGTLKIGDMLVAGTTMGRVRALLNHRWDQLQTAGPSTPVEVIGLSEVPRAGDKVNVVIDDKSAKELVEWRTAEEFRKAKVQSSASTLEMLLSKVKNSATPEVPIIIKADTQGSVEAIAEAIQGIKSEKVKNRIVSRGVGGVSESDISLASASQALVIAFNVRAGRGLDELAEQRGVVVRYFSVIYDIVDTMKAVMAGTLPPIVTEMVQGHAEIRMTIKVPKVGVVAGTSVLDGKITRNSFVRLIRDNVVICSGKLSSLKRFKDDVREVAQGYECGIGIDGYNDLREGDIIESYVMREELASI